MPSHSDIIDNTAKTVHHLFLLLSGIKTAVSAGMAGRCDESFTAPKVYQHVAERPQGTGSPDNIETSYCGGANSCPKHLFTRSI